MTTQRQDLDKAEFVTKCLKEAIVGVVEESLQSQHKEILSQIDTKYKRTKNGCSNCRLDTLMPVHTKTHDGCPFQQKDCNCIYVQGKQVCPSLLCNELYDTIIEKHRFKSPNWSTTDITRWYTNYKEVAKCFIPEEKNVDESQFDCIDLLFLSINNVAVLASLNGSLQNEVIDLLMKIKDAQIKILHVKEIDESTMKRYRTDVTYLLRTDWLKNRREVVDALNTISQTASSDIDEKERENLTTKKTQRTVAAIKRYKQKTDNQLGVINQRLDAFEDRQSNTDSVVSELSMDVKNLKNQYENRIKESETEDSASSVPMKSKCEETPVISRPLDGRLIILDSKQIGALMKVCEKKVMQGGFGSVYVSNSEVSELGVRVVIKKIICTGIDRIKELSTLNEKIAARVMHFAVVPLIAYADEQLGGAKRAYYFLSPYLENESLHGLIAWDKKCLNINAVKMKYANRVQILFQIASALDYLHTPVPEYRGIILHMDVTTMNIVCDKHFNARLIDFGLAREMNEGKQELSFTQSNLLGTLGYHQSQRLATLTVHTDYFNFGVVIRELLTGDLPYVDHGDRKTELRKLDEEIIRKTQQKLIWPDGNEFASGISKLSERCLKSRDEHLTSADIVKELKTMLGNTYQRERPEADEPEADKCDLCMVNAAVADRYAPPHRCKMKICVSCMRNSHINPIRCPTCNEEVIPEIGHTFAALLIAGNDLEDKTFAESFRREIYEIKDVLASKYPCVIGIRDENIKTITPSKPGESEKLLPQVSSAFESFQGKENIGTLLIYFSGHHSPETGFKLGCPDDVLPKTKLHEFLMNLCKFWDNKARILAFLDCCKPPKIYFDQYMSDAKDAKDAEDAKDAKDAEDAEDAEDTEDAEDAKDAEGAEDAEDAKEDAKEDADIKVIQINVCRKNKDSEQETCDSPFQKFFVQALTRKIYNKQCYKEKVSGGNEKECKDCKMPGDFISGERLLTYITDHIKSLKNECKEPAFSVQDVSSPRDCIIGYNVDFAVDLNVKFEVQSQAAIDVNFDQEMHTDIDELKLRILQKVIDRDDVKLTDKFADAIMLRIHIGKGKELTTMLQVFGAMNTNRDIIASYRSVTHIVSGRVAMFTPTGCIYRYFDEKKMLKDAGGGRKEANLSLEDLNKVTDDIDGRPDLATLYKTLLDAFIAWKSETNQEGKELKVIFPCTKTENGNDFVVLDLSEKAEGASSDLTN